MGGTRWVELPVGGTRWVELSRGGGGGGGEPENESTTVVVLCTVSDAENLSPDVWHSQINETVN